MKQILSTLVCALILIITSNNVNAQGCVAIKGSGVNCMIAHPEDTNKAGWTFTSGLRYFKSFRHFSGKDENKDRLVQGTEVINHTYAVDLSLTRIIDDRWSVMLDAPITSNARSSLYEHGLVNGVYIKKERRSTHSFGLGDVRIAVYRWMFDPLKNQKGNIQLGLGIKLPTGDDDVKDYWYNVGPNGTKELRTVDQSIQLGDGGTGFTVEANTFFNFKSNFGVYGNFYYLINPREQNGVRTYRETLVASLANEAICSVPDQYMARGGFNYSFRSLKGLSVSGGVRLEGIPVYDLIGGSGDFRRPGYVWSAEPAFSYSFNRSSLFASVPVAFVRNRTQSVTDKENSATYNKFIRGDAAFANYTINVGFSTRF